MRALMLFWIACGSPTETGTSDPSSTDSSPTTATLPVERPEPALIAADDPGWQYTGRVDATDPAAPVLYWSGSSVSAQIDATSLVLHLHTNGENWINVSIDGEEPAVYSLEAGTHTLPLAEDLAPGPHALRISKRSEAADGWLRFDGVTADGWLASSPAPAFGIEIYGDSITASYSIECSCDEGLAEYKNFDKSYGALTAERLGAEVRVVAISGIGLVKSWWHQTMLDYWDSVVPGYGGWDFSWQPEIVVVNLGQNDYWLGVDSDIRQGYIDFHATLRGVYPNADILFALGSMDAVAAGSPMPGYLTEAVDSIVKGGDSQVHALIFSYNGHGRHPEVADHALMATELTDRILEIRPDLAPTP